MSMKSNRMTKTTATNAARKVYSRLRKVAAPAWIARAIVFIRSVPSSSARTSRTRTAANANASAAAMMAKIRISMQFPSRTSQVQTGPVF